MRNPVFCLIANKDADQLRGNRESDQRLCFRYTDTTILNTKFQASRHLLWLYSSVCVGPGRKPRRPVFSQRGSFCNIARDQTCIENQNATRQLAVGIEGIWREDTASKSLLKCRNIESVKVGKVHQIYSTVRSNALDVRRAEVKAKYTLQSNRASFNQSKVSPKCKFVKQVQKQEKI